VPKLAPMFKCLRAETPRKGRSYGFSRNPRRVVRFYREERRLVDACAMGSSRPTL
jgi:hypothetical protein